MLASHVIQVRSALAVHPTILLPGWQAEVVQVEHDVAPLAANCPVLHVPHVRSEVEVAAPYTRPALHEPETALEHADVGSVVEETAVEVGW